MSLYPSPAVQQKCDARRPCSTCVDAKKKPGECVYDGPRTCHPQTRRILPATANAFSFVYRHESGGVQRLSGASLDETSFVDEGDDLISRPTNQRLTSVAPPGPSGSTASNSFDLSPPSFEDLPLAITHDFGDFFPPPGVPPTASSSDLVLFQGNSPKQDSYEDLCIRSFISSVLFQKPKVPPAPHVPLSFLGEQNTQISHTTPELELSLWVSGPFLLPMACADFGA
jgi:hypothetical protein